ncbi:MAG: cytochrome c maturation protein CcmE [Acidimicrobiales bacterium]
MDLSPRVDQAAPEPPKRRGKRWPAIAVLVLVLGGGVVLVTQFLSSAIDYYCNVDEVGVKDGCEAGRRLRIQGNVVEGSVAQDGEVTLFDVEFNGVTMPVRYDAGDPGGIFQECVPVVVHGRLDNGVFVGDDIEVKHSNEYEAANKDRLDQASNACAEEAAKQAQAQEQQG